MVRKQILQTIEKENLLKYGAHIVLGLSGGPDSVCLFDVLCKRAVSRGWRIYPVHVNHRFRPGEAEADQAYVEALCKERGWPCTSIVCDCGKIAKEEKLTAEEAGRRVRYEAFRKKAAALADAGIPKEDIVIAVAQNADDQAETILFRLLRGTGIDGLTGMQYRRRDEGGCLIVRPLLDCLKSDILDYCASTGLEPRMDHTNEAPVYTRNKIRLELIPLLEREFNPRVRETMIRMGKNCAVDREFLLQTAEEAFWQVCKEANHRQLLLDGERLRRLHRSIRRRVLAMAFRHIGLTEDLTSAHFTQCEEIIFHSHPSARIDLPRGYGLAKHYEHIRVFSMEKKVERPELRIRILSKTEYERLSLDKDSHGVFDKELLEAAYGADFAERILLGFREAGDFIAIKGGKRKKIQDYFVDRKIPKDDRNGLPLVKIGHEVLWITPYRGKSRFSSDFKLCSDTKNVICIEIICGL